MIDSWKDKEIREEVAKIADDFGTLELLGREAQVQVQKKIRGWLGESDLVPQWLVEEYAIELCERHIYVVKSRGE